MDSIIPKAVFVKADAEIPAVQFRRGVVQEGPDTKAARRSVRA